jgi:hypothetical protein
MGLFYLRGSAFGTPFCLHVDFTRKTDYEQIRVGYSTVEFDALYNQMSFVSQHEWMYWIFDQLPVFGKCFWLLLLLRLMI